MAYILQIANPLPGGLDPKTTRFVVGGSTRNDPGTSFFPDQTGYVASSHFGSLPLDTPPNGITITRIPITFTDNATLDRAAQTTKEQLAKMVDLGYVTVTLVGTGNLTGDQIRAL